MELISVIVPVFNVEKYLDECIESICNQTYCNLEIILVNDGSTDNSLEICKKWEHIDDRICVLNQENAGLSAARNAGIDIAKGDIIAFVDSDDKLLPWMYQRLYETMKKNQTKIVVCDFSVLDEEGKNKECGRNLNSKQLSVEEYYDLMYDKEMGMYVPFVVAWNKLYRKEVFKEIRYPNERIHEDSFIIHRLIYDAQKISWINDKLYIYRMRKNSIMKENFSIKKFDEAYAIIDRIHFLQDKGINWKVLNKIVSSCIGNGIWLWKLAKKKNYLETRETEEFFKLIKNEYVLWEKDFSLMPLKIVRFRFFIFQIDIFYFFLKFKRKLGKK